MKNYVLILIISFFSNNQKKEIAITQTVSSIKKNINTLLDSWHNDTTETKFEFYFELMNSITFFINTDAKENWNKKIIRNL